MIQVKVFLEKEYKKTPAYLIEQQRKLKKLEEQRQILEQRERELQERDEEEILRLLEIERIRRLEEEKKEKLERLRIIEEKRREREEEKIKRKERRILKEERQKQSEENRLKREEDEAIKKIFEVKPPEKIEQIHRRRKGKKKRSGLSSREERQKFLEIRQQKIKEFNEKRNKMIRKNINK